MIRLIEARTGRPVPTRAEAAVAERTRAEVAESEVERLRALLMKYEGSGGARP